VEGVLMEDTFKPILRYVDAIPSYYQEQPVLFLRDPLGFTTEIVVVLNIWLSF